MLSVMAKFYLEWRFIPEHVRLLLQPFLAFLAERHIKVPEHAGRY